MSWVAVAVGVGTAAVGAYGARQSNRASERSGAGQVDVTHESNPWAPSVDYRTDLMRRAQAAIPGQTAPPTQAPTAPARGGGGGGRGGGQTYGGYTAAQLQADPSLVNRLGASARQKWQTAGGGRGGAGGGGGTPAPRQFDGMSQETDDIRAAMMQRAQQGNSLYGEAEDYISQNLAGQDANPYRAEQAEQIRRYQEMLLGSDLGMGGGAKNGLTPTGAELRGQVAMMSGGGGGGGKLGYSAGAGGGQAAYGAGPVGVQKDLRSLLDGNDSPAMKGLQESIKRQADSAYNERAKALRLRAAGSGMYGSTPYAQAEAQALSQYGGEIADANAGLYGDMYAQALGLGTQYDIAAQDRAASERNASMAASSASAGQQAELASRERIARLGALGDALGLGNSLAGQYSGDQQYALGQTGNVTGLGLRDWGAAGDISLNADAGRTSWRSSENSLAGVRAGVNLGRQELAFDRYRYDRDAPLNDLARYSDILNAASGGYGVQRDYGRDGRSQSPSYTNPAAAAISGGIGGYTAIASTRR